MAHIKFPYFDDWRHTIYRSTMHEYIIIIIVAYDFLYHGSVIILKRWLTCRNVEFQWIIIMLLAILLKILPQVCIKNTAQGKELSRKYSTQYTCCSTLTKCRISHTIQMNLIATWYFICGYDRSWYLIWKVFDTKKLWCHFQSFKNVHYTVC